MIEIKFRAWTGLKMEYDIVVGKIGAFYAPGLDPKDTACITPNNIIYPKEIPIMQFTGLKDKNGVDIFEGDIVKISISHTEHVVICSDVRFDYGAFVIYDDHAGEPILNDFIASEQYKVEVIGNIHENPELLKAGEK